MAGHRTNAVPDSLRDVAPPQLTAEEWRRAVRVLALCPRHVAVVRRLFEDMPERSIAAELDIKLSTVKQYMLRLRHGLDAGSRLGIVLRTIVAGRWGERHARNGRACPSEIRHTPGDCPRRRKTDSV